MARSFFSTLLSPKPLAAKSKYKTPFFKIISCFKSQIFTNFPIIFAKIIHKFSNKGLEISFEDFAKAHFKLNLSQIFDFYSVFDGLEKIRGFEGLCLEGEFFDAIINILLKNYLQINRSFELEKEAHFALMILAKNSRKRYSINSKITHFKALKTMQSLLSLGFLSLEKSPESPIIRNKRQKLKKDLRGYNPQDKIIFKDNFTRFFYRFLKPNEKAILQAKFDVVLEQIKENLELFQSFCFEQISREFLEYKLKIKGVQSYWDKHLELDLYFKNEVFCIMGEVKFKNKKICKNVLNLLEIKAKKLGLKPNFYALFSKNGFSKELVSLKRADLLLFEMADFKQILKEKNE